MDAIAFYQSWEIRYFKPFLSSNPLSANFGCGASCLQLLTGIPAYDIKNPNKKDPLHWPDHFIIGFLKKYNFKVHKLNINKITYRIRHVHNLITRRHLLLTSQYMYGNVASWFCYFNYCCFHNMEITDVSHFDFVNRPIITAYLLKPPLFPRFC